MPSRSTRLANGRPSFYLMAITLHCTVYILLILESVGTGCFYVLAAEDNAAAHVGVQVSLPDPAFNSSG